MCEDYPEAGKVWMARFKIARQVPPPQHGSPQHTHPGVARQRYSRLRIFPWSAPAAVEHAVSVLDTHQGWHSSAAAII